MDERLDSIWQGIAAPPESRIGQEADQERRKKLREGPPLESAMGGTSDAETAPDESAMNRSRAEAEERRRAQMADEQ